MVVKRIIPDAYMEYEDGHLGVVPASLANVEAKIGGALGGTPGKVYTLAGPDAKKMAKTVFKGGDLLKALEEAFDAGSTRIHAVRLGSPVQADLTLKDMVATDFLKLKGDYGTSGNDHHVNVMHALANIESGYAAAVSGTPNQVNFYDDAFDLLTEVELDAAILTVLGVAVQQFPLGADGKRGFWVLGTAAGGPGLWHYDEAGALVGADTIDLTADIPGGDTATGIARAPLYPGEGIYVTTDKSLLYFLLPSAGVAVLTSTITYADFAGVPADVGGAVLSYDVAKYFQGEEQTEMLLLLERTQEKIYGISMAEGEPPALVGTVDISSWIDSDTAEGIAIDMATLDVLVGIHDGVLAVDRVTRLKLDWTATVPTVAYVDSWTTAQDLKGLGEHIATLDCTTTVKIQDRNMTPYVEYSYSATGTLETVTALVLAAIEAGGVYGVTILEEVYQLLAPSSEDGDGPPDPTWFDAFTGGGDGGALTNGDYLAGLEATVSKIDTNWIHAVGATTNALWTAILLHCDSMFEDHQAERFAILETPAFSSDNEEGTGEYLADLHDYVDNIVTMADQVGDRNAVIFAGGAQFMASDGTTYNRSITAASGGTMASLEVQKSLINKPVRNVLELVPQFSVGHLQSLIQARVNCIRFKPGRGFILVHSLTAAATGSDYSRANDLRAVYYGAKAAREAGQIYVGDENDTAGEGLRKLESAMSRPLEIMRDGGQIDDFELTAVSTVDDRLLGDVYVTLGIQPMRAMEMIYTTVYLK